MSNDQWLFFWANAIPAAIIAPVLVLMWLDKRQRRKDEAAKRSSA